MIDPMRPALVLLALAVAGCAAPPLPLDPALREKVDDAV